MKKLFTLLLLVLFTTIVYSQQFRINFNSFLYKENDQKDFKEGSMETILVFNHNNEHKIMMYTPGNQYLFYMIGSPVKDKNNTGQTYQKITILDTNSQAGILVLFDDTSLGCAIMWPTYQIGLYNK